MNGGLLVQDCEGHAMGRTHGISDGRTVYQITSTHHQMQYPYELPKEDYNVLFTAYGRRSGYYDGDKIDSEIIAEYGEPEIVIYHKENTPQCLAVQGHPEMMPESPVARMISSFVHRLVNNNKK